MSFPKLSQTRVNLKLSDKYKQKQDNHKSIQIVLNNINILKIFEYSYINDYTECNVV